MTLFLKKHKKIILSTIFAVGIVVCLMLANCLSSFIMPINASANSITANSFQMHLISLSKSQLENEAQSRAKDFQQMGAGGYVWKHDEYYHIISSAYLNKADAELVQNSIKINQNLQTTLITIKFNEYSINGTFSNDENKVVSALMSACTSFYTSLYDVSISLDTGVCNETSAKLLVNTAHHNFSTTLANFNTIFPSTPQALKPLYEMTKSAYKIGEKLCQTQLISQAQTYSSLLKYRYTEIMHLYYNFVNN